MSAANRKYPTAILSACVLATLVVPYLYIFLGALASFSLAFSLLALPPFLLGSAFLFWRLLSKVKVENTKLITWLAEIIGWLVVAFFIVVISGFSLLNQLERLGLFCSLYLLATVLCLPVLLITRQAAIEQRLLALPAFLATIVVGLLVLAASTFAFTYLQSSPAFI